MTASQKAMTLPLKSECGTRIVIFGANAEEARVVAVEIAQNAFWNSSYFGGSYEDIRSARLW